jgi:hypothetical protein
MDKAAKRIKEFQVKQRANGDCFICGGKGATNLVLDREALLGVFCCQVCSGLWCVRAAEAGSAAPYYGTCRRRSAVRRHRRARTLPHAPPT